MPTTDRALEAAIAEYLIACEVENKSPRTVQAYAETLRVFMRWVTLEPLAATVASFAVPDAYRFLKAVADSGVAAGTRHRRFREVRAFFSWCVRMGYAPRNPWLAIRTPRLEYRVIRPFAAAEIESLLAVCDPATEFGCRNRALIWLLLDTGLRASEILRVELVDVDWAAQRIHVRHGKGRRQRVVPFGARPAVMLRAYLDDFRGWAPGCLFLRAVGRPRRPLHLFALTTLFDRLGARAGVADAHAHRFRHTFATWALEHHAREIDVQHLLGHATPHMLQRYAATYDATRAAEAHADFSPAARLAGAGPAP